MFNHNHFIAVFAASLNNVMGVDNKMPWHCSADFKWFKGLTRGQAVIMGRKTFESLPHGPLSDRINIVVTRDPDARIRGAVVVHSLAEAARYVMRNHLNTLAYVIGGADLLEQALPYCHTAYVTEIGIEVPVTAGEDIVFAPALPPNYIETTFELDVGKDWRFKDQPRAIVKKHVFQGKIANVFL